MFKIGEFSRLGQVSTRMLRHYDKLGLLQPSQTDRWTGYRYYALDQLARLHRIIALKEMGLTLQQVSDLLATDGELPAEQLRGMLLLRRAELEQELQESQLRLRQVEARLQQIEQAGQPSPYEIVVKRVEPMALASLRQTVPQVWEVGFYCDRMYQQLYAALRRAGIRPLQPEITVYHNDEYTETDLEMETGVPVEPTVLAAPPADQSFTVRELSGHERCAALIYEGPMRDIAPAVLALLTWIGTNRHCVAGPLRELHLSDLAHGAGDDRGDSVVELQAPIEPLAA